jgi:hypothetical protein
MTDEERTEKLKEFIRAEQKSGQSERHVVGDLLEEILEESGEPGLMVSSLEELIHAATAASDFVKKLAPEEAEEEKRFMVIYSVRFFNGSAIVKDDDIINAKAQIEEDWYIPDLTDSCQDTAVDIEAIWELDENNNEVPDTREEFP